MNVGEFMEVSLDDERLLHKAIVLIILSYWGLPENGNTRIMTLDRLNLHDRSREELLQDIART